MYSIWPVLFGWGVLGIVAVLLIGIGFGVMSMTPPDFTIARVCFSAAAIILAIKTGVWLTTFGASRGERIVGAAVLFAIVGAAWMWAYTWVGSRQPKQSSETVSSEELSLFLNCQIANFPITFPPGSTIHMLNPDFPKGLVTLGGPTEIRFPRHDFSGTGYKCEVLNYNKEPMLNIVVIFKVSIYEAERIGSGSHEGKLLETDDCRVEIPIVEEDGRWEFYLFNLNSGRFVEVSPPDTVTAEFRNKSERTEIQLKRNTDTFGRRLVLSAPPPAAPPAQPERKAISVDLLYDPGAKAFNFFNHGKENIYLWGTKLDDGPKSIDKPRVITPTGTYHIFASDVADEVAKKNRPKWRT